MTYLVDSVSENNNLYFIAVESLLLKSPLIQDSEIIVMSTTCTPVTHENATNAQDKSQHC